MNVYLDLMTVMKMQFVLTMMEGIIVLAKEIILGMEDCVLVSSTFYIVVWQVSTILCLYTDKDDCHSDETCNQQCMSKSNSSAFCGCRHGYYLSPDSRKCEGT